MCVVNVVRLIRLRSPSDTSPLCRDYGIYSVTGDKYGREWVRAAWQRDARPRMNYYDADLTASELYLEMLPLFTRGLIELPDHPILLRELRLLERMPGRSGKDQVTHPRGVNDDLCQCRCWCDALAFALWRLRHRRLAR